MAINRRGFLQTAIVAAGAGDEAFARQINPDVPQQPRLLRVQDALAPQAMPLCCVISPFGLKLDKSGRLVSATAAAHDLGEHLQQTRSKPQDDSPLFRLLADLPRLQVDRASTDLLRARTNVSQAIADRLRNAL